MVAASTGIVTTVAGSGNCPAGAGPISAAVCAGGFGGDGGPANNATLHHAQAAATDAAGNLYIADTINHRIRRVDAATGVIYHRRDRPQWVQRRWRPCDGGGNQLSCWYRG